MSSSGTRSQGGLSCGHPFGWSHAKHQKRGAILIQTKAVPCIRKAPEYVRAAQEGTETGDGSLNVPPLAINLHVRGKLGQAQSVQAALIHQNVLR